MGEVLDCARLPAMRRLWRSAASRCLRSVFVHTILTLGFAMALDLAPRAVTRRPTPATGTSSRRHVLLLTVDTLRADYVGRNDLPEPTTPFIDSLLASGVTYSRARSDSDPAYLAGLCEPPHRELSAHPPGSDVVRHVELGRDPSCRAHEQKGFATFAVVSNAVLGPGRGLDRGFDVYDSVAFVETDAKQTTNRVIRQLQSKSAKDSIFLWVLYIDPHVPYFPPKELAKKFDPSYTGRYKLHFGRRGLGESAYPADLGKVKAVFQNDLPEPVNAHVRRLYAADVRHADDQISRLLGWLRKRFGDDWTIVFAADHGESLGEHDFYYDHGDYVYNATLRVPLGIVLGKNDPLRRHAVVDSWVSLVDVVPTMMDLLGIPVSKPMAEADRGPLPVARTCGERPRRRRRCSPNAVTPTTRTTCAAACDSTSPGDFAPSSRRTGSSSGLPGRAPIWNTSSTTSAAIRRRRRISIRRTIRTWPS